MPEPYDKDESPGNLERGSHVGQMLKRAERMADGRRYIIYYTFGERAPEGKIDNKEGTP